MKTKLSVLLAFSCIVLLLSCNKQGTTADEHSVGHSLADLKVYDGLKVSLFASEPMFSNPTNISVDSKGRLWVCEAYNYRNALNPKNPEKKEGDRIMILEDTDGDGKADKSKVFYQGTDVNAALGICVLGNRVFVSCSPNVFVFTDENGDDVPDKKELLFTGIKGEQHDHGMHTFTFGPDGRLYFNMGNEGKLLLNAKGDTIVDKHGRQIATNGKPFYQGMALRCALDGSDVEVLGHNFRNNFELTVDPFGNIWQSDNDDDGNKGTRINYVMEQGNYGYTDEMTGAGWSARRTNMEKEIPHRHWHLNDPGVVPNVLQTGSGSPSGITFYEGSMLPEVFRSKVIHAEPGHNVVRAYPMTKDGAGYKAEIVNLLEGQQDQWFRPVDVTAGPDGSLFIADWYDPGVGGHQVGDLDRGRIYRVTASETAYKVTLPDLTTVDGAIQALLSPNTDVRYQGWTALAEMGENAEPALEKLFSSENPYHRAQALWLLTKSGSKRDQYFDKAMNDNNPDIQVTAIRAARRWNYNVLQCAARLANASSPEVRREVAIAIRGNQTPEAAAVWTQLATQYDGKDRWYLEALGISAEGNWDNYFAAWLKKVGNDWNKGANKDIVWRSRGKNAIPLLAKLIESSKEDDMLRYFRAFDFHRDVSKQKALESLVARTDGEKLMYSLKHMDASQLKMTPAITAKLNKVLAENKGTIEYVELVSSLKMESKSQDLLELAIQQPDSLSGKEAAKVLVRWKKTDLIEKVLTGQDKGQAQGLVKALASQMGNQQILSLMETIVLDSTKDVDIRRQIVRSFLGPWEAEDRLLKLAQDKKLPKDVHQAAAGVFQTAWRANIREDGAKYLQVPGTKEGGALPSISVLASMKGKSSNGKEVFKNVCANCHRVNNEGVNFGPDLSEIGDKLSKEALYKAILFPDQGISFGYEAYKIKMKDGTEAFGRILSETEDKIELQYINQQQSLNKVDVVSKTMLTNSLMPNNLHSTISQQELVDLVEYLTELKKKGNNLATR